MKRLLEIPEYCEDLAAVTTANLPWHLLRGKTLLVSGATGLIGSFLVDVLHAKDLSCKVIVLGRSEKKAKARFAEYLQENFLRFVKWDISSKDCPKIEGPVDYILHLASNTHPVAYATDPIGTITANVITLNNLLDFASRTATSLDSSTGMSPRHPRFLFASSNEIYGENRGDVELFGEEYCGFIDCNTLRAGYPESKRCGEALCQAYIRQKGLDCVIARLTRTYGPTILPTDTKAISQFFRNACLGEDIVLKSEGKQYYSYQYVADSVSGLLTVLLRGETGAAYNIADESGDVTLRDLASLIAAQSGRRVVFELPNATEAAGFSRATKARLDGTRLRNLGWAPLYNIQTGVKRNFRILTMAN